MKVSLRLGSKGGGGVRAQHSLYAAHSMMASPTATSLAMEFSLDLRVSIVGVEDTGTSFLPWIPVCSCSSTPATSLHRSEYRCCGQLYL